MVVCVCVRAWVSTSVVRAWVSTSVCERGCMCLRVRVFACVRACVRVCMVVDEFERKWHVCDFMFPFMNVSCAWTVWHCYVMCDVPVNL